MELNPYDPISHLDPTTYDWKCLVRVQSVWKGVNRESQEFWGLNMMLIDDSNSRIHAFANSKYCDDLQKDIKEGEIYVISNFKVKDYLGDEKYRCVHNKRHIFFTTHTEFKKPEKIPLPIEKYAFDLFHCDEVEKLADDNRFLIDMVGKVKNIQELIKTTKNEEEITIFKFQITNGRSNVQVTFFDTFGEELEKEFGKLDCTNLYVIISCAKVGRYEGIPHLSNYPATRVFTNPAHYSIEDLKKGITAEKEDKPLTVHMQDKVVAVEIDKKIMTVKEIKNLTAANTAGTVYCQLIVKRIMDKKNWYFRKCTGCDLELEHVEGKYKCSREGGCGRIIPYPDKRFRLCTLCSDDTGSIAIIFPDCEITRMIEKTVIDLHADCVEEADEEKFPEMLNCFLKQKYTMNLYVNEDNIEKGSTVYNAKQIVQAQEKGDSFDPNKSIVVEAEEVSMANVTDTQETAHQTPNTGNSTNTKSRARKITAPLAYNPTDPSAIHPEKNVKIEKLSK